jgi:hypothetical protein
MWHGESRFLLTVTRDDLCRLFTRPGRQATDNGGEQVVERSRAGASAGSAALPDL